MNNLGELTGTVKYYDWGGSEFIPLLIQQKDVNNKPFAEYWLGVHPQADCKLIFPNGQTALLRDYIQQHPALLGRDVEKHFGNIPYLLKALDVKDMLSIQVHPTKAAAEEDYEMENKKGVPLNSPERNYKDRNHKPELMVAMGEFWLLHGFRPEDSLKNIFSTVAELNFLAPVFEKSGYAGLYKTVMELPQSEVDARIEPLLKRILPLYNEGKLAKDNPDYWAAKGHLAFSQPGKTDRGIFSVYLFNLVKLNNGEAVFQDAGVPHAYLLGKNIEIMASSDNVLRGGLTTKHVDVPELLKHVKPEATHPAILKGDAEDNEIVYKTVAPDFELRRFDLQAGETVQWTPSTAEILLLTSGEVSLEGSEGEIWLRMGKPSAAVFPGGKISLEAHEPSVIFRATVPVNK